MKIKKDISQGVRFNGRGMSPLHVAVYQTSTKFILKQIRKDNKIMTNYKNNNSNDNKKFTIDNIFEDETNKLKETKYRNNLIEVIRFLLSQPVERRIFLSFYNLI